MAFSFEEQNVPETEFSSTFNVKLTLRLKKHLLKEREEKNPQGLRRAIGVSLLMGIQSKLTFT